MIDFIHLYSKVDDHKIYLGDKYLRFVEGVEYLKQKRLSYFWYKDKESKMLFKIGYKNWIDISGSLTKYQYEENYSNLTYSDLCFAIDSLAKTVNKRPNELILRSFEFGLNIHMFNELKALELTDLAFNYKKNFFESIESKNKDPISIGKRCRLQKYDVKIYNKSIEYDLPFDLLRVEVKINKMSFVNRIEIKYLEDLKDLDKLDALMKILIETVENIFFYDTSIPFHLLTPIEKQQCLNWQSELYRKKLIKEHPKKYEYKRKKMKVIVEKYGVQNINKRIIENLKKEFNHFKNN
jgi:hypothetical protein